MLYYFYRCILSSCVCQLLTKFILMMMMIAAIHCMVELNKQLVTHNTSLLMNLE